MTQLPVLPTPSAAALLDPATLAPQARQAAEELLAQGSSPHTRRSYGAALRYWAAWFQVRYGQPLRLPIDEAAVIQFIVDHAARQAATGVSKAELPDALDRLLVEAGFKGRPGPMALNTLVHRVSVLSKAHANRHVANPCQTPTVLRLLKAARAASLRQGQGPKRKPALTADLVNRLLDTCDESLAGQRDRALLLFAFASGGRRRSEVAGATMENLKVVGDSFVYKLALSKTNQAGEDRPENHKPVAGRAAEALRAWLETSNTTSGPIFRRVLKGGHLGDSLSASAIREIVKHRCLLAGLTEDYSAHSLRSGFVTEADEQGVSRANVMALTGHRSEASVAVYTRAKTALNNPAATLLDAQHKHES